MPGGSFRDRALTWQQVVCILLAFPILIFAAMAFNPAGAHERRIGQYGLAVLLALFVASLMLHVRFNWRADEVPDVLARLFPIGDIYQAGSCHFVASLQQQGAWLVARAVIQNLRDGDGEFQLRFAPESAPRKFRTAPSAGSGAVADILPPLHCAVPPAAVVVARVRVPLDPVPRRRSTRVFIDATGRAAGRQVRFGRRNGVTKAVDRSLSLALLFAGHFVHGSGTHIPVALEPFAPDADAITADHAAWAAEVLWSADDPATVQEITSALGAPPEYRLQ